MDRYMLKSPIHLALANGFLTEDDRTVETILCGFLATWIERLRKRHIRAMLVVASHAEDMFWICSDLPIPGLIHPSTSFSSQGRMRAAKQPRSATVSRQNPPLGIRSCTEPQVGYDWTLLAPT